MDTNENENEEELTNEDENSRTMRLSQKRESKTNPDTVWHK